MRELLSLCAALVGPSIESIPTRWLDRLQQRQRIDRAADWLALLSGD